jgi:hypothetical protein
MSNLDSFFSQNALLIGAALFLIWEIIGGWRRGLIRSGLHFGAFVASGFVGMVAGKSIASVISIVLPGMGIWIGLATGLLVALLVLGVCLFLSALAFKRTSHQPPGLTRWMFGIGGAFFGLLTGLFLLWGGISIIRTTGTLANTGLTNKTTPAISSPLTRLKDSLETGPLGGIAQNIDLMPSDAYERIARIGDLSKNPDAMMRFLDYPGMSEIISHPRIQALLQDPAVVQAAENKNIFALIQSPALLNAATDASLQKAVMNLDLEKALDYAMPPKQNPATKKTTP